MPALNPQAALVQDLYPDHPRSGMGYSALTFDCLCALWAGPMRPGALRQVMRINERRANKNCERVLASLKKAGVIHQVALCSPRSDRPHPGLEIANRTLALTILSGPVSNRGSAGNHVRVVPQAPELTAALQRHREESGRAAVAEAIAREELLLSAIGLRPPKTADKPTAPVILPELHHEYSGTAARAASRQAVSAATYGYRSPVLRPGALDALRHQDRHRYGGNVEQALGVTAAAGR